MHTQRYDTLPASPQEEILLETSSERKDDLASNQAMVPVEISIVGQDQYNSIMCIQACSMNVLCCLRIMMHVEIIKLWKQYHPRASSHLTCIHSIEIL